MLLVECQTQKTNWRQTQMKHIINKKTRIIFLTSIAWINLSAASFPKEGYTSNINPQENTAEGQEIFESQIKTQCSGWIQTHQTLGHL